jgi:ribosomal protein L7/L12
MIIKYAIKYQEFNVTEAEFDLVWIMNNSAVPMRIEAIKFIRNQYGCDLKTAKDVCDAIAASTRRVVY